ncbi:MAG: DUF4157 domain-containing protein [Candidatus Methanoperedens sp.]|nr:DUF4157 domain-containing protein [Candidatus Methanoperedens sp.]
MAERAQISIKKPEAKRENKVSQRQKMGPSQSISSPIEQILFLQRTIGNQAVGRLLKSGALQAKLRIGQPGDIYEQEADRMAEQVMRMPEPKVANETKVSNPAGNNSIQRKCLGCKNGTKIKKEEDEEKLQKKEASGSTHELTPELDSSIRVIRGGGQPLPESVRAFYEPRFGADFSEVRVHTGSYAAETAKSINARAFTVGNNIAFGGGQFVPGSQEGRKLLAHELTHTIQQGATSISPSASMSYSPAADPFITVQNQHSTSTVVQPKKMGSDPIAPPPGDKSVITAERIGDREFEQLTGMPTDMLPEGLLVKDLGALAHTILNVPADTLPPGVAPEVTDSTNRDLTAAGVGAAIVTPSPISYVPANATGIMWVQGHLSIFAKVNGTLTIRGFRGHQIYYIGEMVPGPIGEWFSKQLNLGFVPGGFKNDVLFPKVPGKQTVIYVTTDLQTAETFRDHLKETQYNETYKYSTPRPDAKQGSKEWRMHQLLKARGGDAMTVQCGNQCSTVPVRQIEGAIGMRPHVDTPGGRLDITTGRTGGGPVDPYEKGRAKRMKQFFEAPNLSGARPGSARISMTPGAVMAMGAIRIGGGIWMLYGGYQSVRRLMDAWGTEDFAQVMAEESGAWGGGIGGAELGGAIAEGIGESVFLVAGGEVSALFVVGGFGLALGVGYLGAMVGEGLVRAVFNAPQVLVGGTVMILEGFMEATQITGHVVGGILIDIKLRPQVVAHEWANPNNWDLRGLSPAASQAVRSLGMTAWSMLGSLNPDDLRAQAEKTFAELGVPKAVAAGASLNLVPAGILITADDILALRPLEFVHYLKSKKSLDFVQDPEVLADNELYPEGHKPDEAYLNVHLAPLIATARAHQSEQLGFGCRRHRRGRCAQGRNQDMGVAAFAQGEGV